MITPSSPRRPTGRGVRPTWLGALLGVVLALVAGGTVHADPAGPTDYRTEILSIEPAVEGVELRVIGGDSFVQLSVDEDVEASVVGYFGEPYLWFLPDGTVLENRNSPTTYQNEERYGTDAPDFASADAEPDWAEVSDDGSYAWHDHRAHWMQPIRPAGMSPGDQILEQVIPITVDDVEVRVTVISTWLPEPSSLPIALGVVIGVVGLALAVLLARGRRMWSAMLVPVSAGAAVAGLWQYASLPSETGPRLVWPALPVVALLAAMVSVVLWRTNRFLALGVTLLGAVQLVIWAAIKRDGITAAIVPTDAPQWFDRSMVVAAFVTGVGVGVLALREVFSVDTGTPDARATT